MNTVTTSKSDSASTDVSPANLERMHARCPDYVARIVSDMTKGAGAALGKEGEELSERVKQRCKAIVSERITPLAEAAHSSMCLEMANHHAAGVAWMEHLMPHDDMTESLADTIIKTDALDALQVRQAVMSYTIHRLYRAAIAKEISSVGAVQRDVDVAMVFALDIYGGNATADEIDYLATIASGAN